LPITLEELATHTGEEDCWVGYEGKVYDVSSFLPKHPGGVGAIYPFCGTSSDFTAAFEGKHGMTKVEFLQKLPLMGDLAQ
jgi:cytochrome b involved in lipid metabolism